MHRILVKFGIFCAVLVFSTNAENRSENRTAEEISNHEFQAGTLMRRSFHFHSPLSRSVKKYVWQPTWVKTWHVKKTYIPIWKRVWRPREIRPWYPRPLVLIKPRARVIVKRILHNSI